jgi:hypothetical protein
MILDYQPGSGRRRPPRMTPRERDEIRALIIFAAIVAFLCVGVF